MIGLGTIVNVVAIIVGAAIGSFIKSGISERFKNIILQAVGLSVIMIGISGTLQGIYTVIEGGKLDRQFIMLMIFSLVIGGIIGEALNIELKLENMGKWFQGKFAKEGGAFAKGFVTASLIFCVGAMAIVGALEDGVAGNTATLFAKSILDGTVSIILATTLGFGVAFSFIPVLIYQGGITLLAGVIKPWLTPEVITQLSLVGSVLIMGIGINILEVVKIKVGNLLPAVFIPLIYYVMMQMI